MKSYRSRAAFVLAVFILTALLAASFAPAQTASPAAPAQVAQPAQPAAQPQVQTAPAAAPTAAQAAPAQVAQPARQSGKKPLIGITAGILPPEISSGVEGAERHFQSADYANAVVAAGGVPVLLPPVTDQAVVKQLVESVDGLLVAGGPDINPLYYKEEPVAGTETISADRDAFDLAAIKIAGEENKPVLGICRGEQAINVAFGGTLYQDVSLKGAVVKHMQKAKRDVATHTVFIAPNTHLATILKEKTLTVNSFHHQSVKNPAPGFIVSAQSPDGIAEAIENPKYRFMLGVQWHPEGMYLNRPDMLGVIKAFVDAARK